MDGSSRGARSCPVGSGQTCTFACARQHPTGSTYQAEVLHDSSVHLLVHLARLQLAYHAAALVGEEGLQDKWNGWRGLWMVNKHIFSAKKEKATCCGLLMLHHASRTSR